MFENICLWTLWICGGSTDTKTMSDSLLLIQVNVMVLKIVFKIIYGFIFTLVIGYFIPIMKNSQVNQVTKSLPSNSKPNYSK